MMYQGEGTPYSKSLDMIDNKDAHTLYRLEELLVRSCFGTFTPASYESLENTTSSFGLHVIAYSIHKAFNDVYLLIYQIAQHPQTFNLRSCPPRNTAK